MCPFTAQVTSLCYVDKGTWNSCLSATHTYQPETTVYTLSSWFFSLLSFAPESSLPYCKRKFSDSGLGLLSAPAPLAKKREIRTLEAYLWETMVLEPLAGLSQAEVHLLQCRSSDSQACRYCLRDEESVRSPGSAAPLESKSVEACGKSTA